jgi:hypothetical protein
MIGSLFSDLRCEISTLRVEVEFERSDLKFPIADLRVEIDHQSIDMRVNE